MAGVVEIRNKGASGIRGDASNVCVGESPSEENRLMNIGIALEIMAENAAEAEAAGGAIPCISGDLFYESLVSNIAPELIAAIKGCLVLAPGEFAGCLEWYKPYYPGRASDIIGLFGPSPCYGLEYIGSMALENPLLVNDTYIYKAVQYDLVEAKRAGIRDPIESFIAKERKRIGIDGSKGVIPEGCELCYYLIILKINNGKKFRVTIASAARKPVY